MASSINASTTAGVVTTADTSGVLNIQTAGTTAIAISAGQVATFAQAPFLLLLYDPNLLMYSYILLMHLSLF